MPDRFRAQESCRKAYRDHTILTVILTSKNEMKWEKPSLYIIKVILQAVSTLNETSTLVEDTESSIFVIPPRNLILYKRIRTTMYLPASIICLSTSEKNQAKHSRRNWPSGNKREPFYIKRELLSDQLIVLSGWLPTRLSDCVGGQGARRGLIYENIPYDSPIWAGFLCHW